MNQRSSQATASAFGWDFQSNAAIFMFVENIKEAKNIKVEGAKEDIEIIMKDNSVLYAQAKSVVVPTDVSFVIDKLKSAVKTLNKASETISCKLFYVTNSTNPFNVGQSENSVTRNTCTQLAFKELSQAEKDVIIKAVGDQNIQGFCYNDFYLLTIPFHGEADDNRYKEIIRKVNEFFTSLGKPGDGYGKKLLEIWQNNFFKNCTSKKLHITKEKFLWPIVVFYCDEEPRWLREEYDDADVSEVLTLYSQVIDNASEGFALISRVTDDYERFVQKNINVIGSDRIKLFVKSYVTHYVDEFNYVTNTLSLHNEILTKLVLYRIVSKRVDIDKLRRFTNI